MDFGFILEVATKVVAGASVAGLALSRVIPGDTDTKVVRVLQGIERLLSLLAFNYRRK